MTRSLLEDSGTFTSNLHLVVRLQTHLQNQKGRLMSMMGVTSVAKPRMWLLTNKPYGRGSRQRNLRCQSARARAISELRTGSLAVARLAHSPISAQVQSKRSNLLSRHQLLQIKNTRISSNTAKTRAATITRQHSVKSKAQLICKKKEVVFQYSLFQANWQPLKLPKRKKVKR